MERVVVNRSFTLYKTFYEGGVAVDPDSPPVVTVTRATGESVFAGGVIDEAATGTWSVTVPATSNNMLDTLTLDWAGIVNGVEQEYVDKIEVTGGELFTIAEARALAPLNNEAAYPNAAINGTRVFVEQAFEDVTERAFVPRYRLETTNGTGTNNLQLERGEIRVIRSVTVDGVEGDPTTIAFRPTGLAYYPAGWTNGYGNVVVGYEYGRDYAPERIRRAAVLLARSWLVAGPIDDRAATYNIADGGTYSLIVPGRGGSVFGLPEVDEAVRQYSLAVNIS